ncbi:MAG: acetylglutamate kinase [Eubacteriaceae bacterium]|nr:acetylglutamate kinase [Eubacteriaceae bacterium]
MVNDKYMERAKVLIEALPYIQRFNRKIIVVKYGGAAMESEELKKSVIADVVLLKLVGFKPIIVHGGGKEISKWVGKAGIQPEFYDGLRITDADTLEVAEMVLGKVNKELVTMVGQLGVKAIGISGKDGRMLTVKKKMPNGKDIGYVGEIEDVDVDILYDMLDDDFLPIIYPIGVDREGQGYNINADYVASAVAEAMKANKLAFLTDIDGVYKDPDDPDSVISELYVDEAKKLIEDGTINGGMLPKVKNCIDAIDNGVTRVHILDGTTPHALLMEIFTDKGVGTAILSQEEGRYYDESRTD